MQREKKFTKIQQKAFLQQAYPNGHFYAETPTSFCWKYSVQPSSLSGTYQFKICYKEGKHVDVFALDKLSLCEGEKGLPHVYNTDKQVDTEMLLISIINMWQSFFSFTQR